MKVTLSIMCYNQDRFIEDAILGALAQDYDGLNIVISDDNSNDRTYDIVERLIKNYSGPHNITLNRNMPNLGLIGHVNKIFEISADSDLIVYNAGDDISLENRVSVLVQQYCKTKPLLLHSNVIDMNEDGTLRNNQKDRERVKNVMEYDLAKTAKTNSSCLGATCAWSPEIMEIFGPIFEEKCIEDRVLYFRARLVDRASYIDQRLLKYRRGVGLTARKASDLNFDRRYLEMDIASFKQRLVDTIKISPERKDVIKALEHKISIRTTELANILIT